MKLRQYNESKTIKSAKSILPGQWLYYSIGIAGGLISLFLWYASILQSNANLKHIIELQAEHIANDIKILFELRISALKHVAKHLEDSPTISLNNWQSNVSEFVNNSEEFKAIAVLDQRLQPVLVLPSSTPEINQLYKAFSGQYMGTLKKQQNSQIWLSPMVRTKNGHNYVFIAIPLTLANHLSENYLISIIDVKNIVNLSNNHDDYRVTVYENNQTIYEDPADKPLSNIESAVVNVDIHGIPWKVMVQPSMHLVSVIKTDLPSVAMMLGTCIAILFILTTHLAQLARARAKSLDQINQDLQAEIADRMVAEESKQKLEIELLQGQKLQAIGTLAGGIAHDFNNILYAIIGYVEMAREDVTKDSLVYNNLGKVLEASQRGQELISRILAFSRRQHHEFKPIAIKSTIESVLSLLKPTIPASVSIDFIDDLSEDFTILGDQTRLHQIIVNLINNAVDAMDGEGTVIIRLSLIGPEDELLQQFSDIRHCKYCRIDLIDTGHGMDQSMVARIFEPFFTTKEVGKGTGLGLATVHTTVKEHHGEILVTSQLGHGSSFTILLPEYKTGE